MTEEIIIDGIDVSKCEVFFKANKTCYNCYACEGSDCYFKQLKRLEQENKELKKENETINYQWHKQSEIGEEWYKVAERYKSALEKIRDLCIHYENTNDKCVTNCYAHFIVTDLIQDKINEALQ